MLTLVGNAILGCCGYGPLIQNLVHAAVVSGTEEEVDAFLEQGEQQNKLLVGITGVSWKVKTGNTWLASYVIPVLYNSMDKYLNKPAIKYTEKYLEYNSHYNSWSLLGGVYEKSPFVEWLNKNNKQDSYFVGNFIPIQSFGTNKDLFLENKKHALKHTSGIFGVAFVNPSEDWIKKEIASLKEEYDILVDALWHNPRYAGADHDLHTLFFTRKQ